MYKLAAKLANPKFCANVLTFFIMDNKVIEIKNKQLRSALEKIGLGHIHLYRNGGYFYVFSDMYFLNDTGIHGVTYFKQLTIEHWIRIIKDLFDSNEDKRLVDDTQLQKTELKLIPKEEPEIIWHSGKKFNFKKLGLDDSFKFIKEIVSHRTKNGYTIRMFDIIERESGKRYFQNFIFKGPKGDILVLPQEGLFEEFNEAHRFFSENFVNVEEEWPMA